MGIAQIIAFLIQAEPEIQALILSVVQMIKDNQAGIETADKAKADALAALGLMMGRQADPAAQDAADLAAVIAEAKAKFNQS